MFDGDNTSDILASILKEEPDLDRIPAKLRPVVAKCLRKDAHMRWRDIGDVRLALEEVPSVNAVPSGHSSSVATWIPWTMVCLLATALIAAGLTIWRITRSVPQRLLRLSVQLPAGFQASGGSRASISPDGSRLVFASFGPAGNTQLFTRPLDAPESTALAGTEGVSGAPFFSPDGDWVGFFANGKLKTIPIQGGAPVVICDAPNPRGASWGRDGTIVLAPNLHEGLFRVSANGGTPERLTQLESGESTHRWPQVLPGGKAVLYTAAQAAHYEEAAIQIVALTTGKKKTIHSGGTYGRYAASGHLLYIHQSMLFARTFDLDREEITGQPTPILENMKSSAISGDADFDFSAAPSGHGTLIYFDRKGAESVISWLDAEGVTRPIYSVPGYYVSPRLSPDGKRVAVALFSGNLGLWVFDSERDTFVRLTNSAGVVSSGDAHPVWSPDGEHIAYAANQSELFWVRSDGSAAPQRLITAKALVYPYSFSPDGKWLAYYDLNAQNPGGDILLLPLQTSKSDHPTVGEPEYFLRTPASERDPAFSPDGRWIAYTSDESGQFEIYVRPFPGPGAKWRVSTAGGRLPAWSRFGTQLAYETLDNRLMITTYGVSGQTFRPGKPRLWSSERIFYNGQTNMDFAPDGKRFAVLMPAQAGEEAASRLGVLVNFLDEIRRRVPGGN